MKLYKVLNADGSAYHGGTAVWLLPTDKPGEWMPAIIGDLVPCENGYHLCRETDLIHWLGPAIFTAEYEGECVTVDTPADSKVVVRKARLLASMESWNEKTARLFAADCAERVLPIYERQCPNDDRPRKAIEAVRAYAKGEIMDAAWDAAGAAARAAAGAAAGTAAWAAAGAAARAAAGAAAWDAAGAAAWNAAGAAARAAAGAAAGTAAGAAARDAERDWQIHRLFDYLEGRVVRQPFFGSTRAAW